MRALVTGAGGFCGRHLITYLVSQDLEVYTLGIHEGKHENHCRVGNITNVAELTEILKKVQPDYIFHLAGTMTAASPEIFYQVNTLFGVSLLSAMKQAGLTEKPVLLVGSSAEYGKIDSDHLPISEGLCPQPYNYYGISKLAQTLEGQSASQQGFSVVTVRPFNILGPQMPDHLVVQSFALQIVKVLNGQIPPVIRVGNLKSSRDFVDIEDVVRVFWDLLKNPIAYGEIVNVCTGKPVAIEDILHKLVEFSGKSIEIFPDPARMKTIDVPVHYGDTEKLYKLLGYRLESRIDISLNRVLNQLKFFL